MSRRIASTRRQFLKQGAALTGAGAFGAATSLSASASATLQAAAKGGIYISRSLVLAAYFGSAPTATSTLVFASLMGFLWLGYVRSAELFDDHAGEGFL